MWSQAELTSSLPTTDGYKNSFLATGSLKARLYGWGGNEEHSDDQ